jgi:nucleotide-binding universal stress UspA family protein
VYQRILVAVDESTTSELALKEAALLAKEQHATVRLSHVVDDTYSYTALETPRQMADRQAELRKAGKQVLTSAAALTRALGVTAETTLLEIVEPGKHVYDSIEQEAARWPADLIVIGTHGRRGFRRLLLGSVAEGLIRITTKPVLLVRGE